MDSEQPVEQVKAEPVAWMYHHPGDLEHGWQRFTFERRIQTYEGMSCNEEDAGVIETPLYATPQPAASDGLVDNKAVQRAVMASVNLGAWMSAALDDPAVCAAMKADIQEWFSAGEPVQLMDQALAQIKRKPDAE